MFFNSSIHEKERMRKHEKMILLDFLLALIFSALCYNNVIPQEYYSHEFFLKVNSFVYDISLLFLLFVYMLKEPHRYIGDNFYYCVKYYNRMFLNSRTFLTEQITFIYFIGLFFSLFKIDAITIPLVFFTLISLAVNLAKLSNLNGKIFHRIYSSRKFNYRIERCSLIN